MPFASLQAIQLKKQRDMYEADIAQLHASTMALVHDVGGLDLLASFGLPES